MKEKDYLQNEKNTNAGPVMSTRFNQVDQVEADNEKLKEIINQQKGELLDLYRRILRSGY